MLYDLEILLKKDHSFVQQDPWIGHLSSAAAWARSSRVLLHRKVGAPIFDPACRATISQIRPFGF